MAKWGGLFLLLPAFLIFSLPLSVPGQTLEIGSDYSYRTVDPRHLPAGWLFSSIFVGANDVDSGFQQFDFRLEVMVDENLEVVRYQELLEMVESELRLMRRERQSSRSARDPEYLASGRGGGPAKQVDVLFRNPDPEPRHWHQALLLLGEAEGGPPEFVTTWKNQPFRLLNFEPVTPFWSVCGLEMEVPGVSSDIEFDDFDEETREVLRGRLPACVFLDLRKTVTDPHTLHLGPDGGPMATFSLVRRF